MSSSSSLFTGRKYLLALGAVGIIATFGFSALFAHANSGPLVTTSTTNASNVVVTSAVIGTNVVAGAKIASSTASTTPTGTVAFSKFNNLACSGTPTVQSGVGLVNGMASSSAITMMGSGISYLVTYHGDASNSPSVSSCAVVTPASASVTVTNALSATTVNAGSSITAHATLSGNTAAATGTVAYKVYANNTCTTATTSPSSVTVVNGVVPASSAVSFNQAGSYYWQAVYSGDNVNTAATSSCGLLTVVPVNTPVPPVATTTASGTISGTVFNDTNDNERLDNGESGIAGVMVWLHMVNWNRFRSPIVATTTTDSLGHYTFSNLAPGKYYVGEQVTAGWNQTSDNRKVRLNNRRTSATVNFSNVSASSTPNGENNDGEDKNDDKNGHWGHSRLNLNFNSQLPVIDPYIHAFLNHGDRGDNGKHKGEGKNN